MYAAQLGLAGLELLEKIYQLLALLAINSGAQLGLKVDGDFCGTLEHPLPLPREVQPANAAVLRVRPSLDEPLLLEGVHEGHHPARRHSEPFGQRLL